MKKMLIIFVAVMLIFTACAPQQRPQQRPQEGQQERAATPQQDLETNESSITQMERVRNCRITDSTVDVKAGTGEGFRTIGTLRQNQEVNVLDQVGDWYIIQMNNNEVGAIDATKATPIIKEGDNLGNQPVQQPQVAQQPNEAQQQRIPQQEAQQTPQTQQGQQPQTQQAPATQRLSTQEQQMVDLVNRERAKNGLAALTVDLEVAKVAGIKSQDMVDNNYFSHNSPTYGSPFDMLKKFGISYLHAGENLAGNATVEKAHNALMNSSGHRQNILSPNFTHIGIGVRPSGKYGYIYTQMFISKPR
ncbi:CAP domain-containing protein [Geosporobacter ferrireducens]|nr:CAP domain-containing protein [Geosporobacter ferrireducens]